MDIEDRGRALAFVLGELREMAGVPNTRMPVPTRAEEWEAVEWLIAQNNLGALLYPRLRENRSTIPEKLLGTARSSYLGNLLRSRAFRAELGSMAETLLEKSLETVLLKGAALWEDVYSDDLARPMSDIDLLVRARDVPAWEQLLRDRGYVPYEGFRSAEWYRKHHHHLVPYHRPGTFLKVELHLALAPPQSPLQMPLEELWGRSLPAPRSGLPYRVLAPEDMLVHLALHLTYEHTFWQGLLFIADLHHFITAHRSDLDWRSLSPPPGGLPVARGVYYGLLFAREMFGTRPDPLFWERLRVWARVGGVHDRMIRSMAQGLMAPPVGRAGLPPWVRRNLFRDLLRGRTALAVFPGFLRAMLPTGHPADDRH